VLLEKDENNSIGNTTASWSENKSADLINALIKCTQFISRPSVWKNGRQGVVERVGTSPYIVVVVVVY
jgi:hypothetical protein